MPQKTIRVLSIEGNGGDARLIQATLDEAAWLGGDLPRFEVVHAGSLAAGLARLDEGGIDAVLADLDLPDSEAGEPIARLRAHAPHVPVVGLTGCQDRDLARRALRTGAEDCLFKRELSAPLLARALSYAVERQQVRRALQEVHQAMERRVHDRTAALKEANEQLQQEVAERRQAEAALQESEDKYRSLFNQSVSGIYLHDFEGRIVDVNQMACLQSGYSREELLQLTVFDLHPKGAGTIVMPPDEILRQWSEWQPEQRSTLEAEHQRKDGTIFPAEISTGVIRYGERHLMLAIVQDISERKQAAAEQQELQARLAQAQKMEAVGRLAGGVAHDFNNMLGVIMGHAELAMRHIDPDHALYSDLVEIHQAAQRSTDLTRQLLAFARKQIITPVVIELNGTIERMLKMLRRLIGEDIELIWRPGVALWPVKIDPGQFSQILINLCLNARDAIAGVGAIVIETQNAARDEAYTADRGWFVPGEYVQLAVSDTGYGMDHEVLTNLFEPYFTTKQEGQSGGLGLATVYGAVKQNRGFIHVYSEPGHGTTVKIYLPRAVGPTVTIETARPSVSGGQETVLVVEDEPAILRLATTVLERLGYTVLTASHPGEALARAMEYAGTIDLLVTDVVMPEMNGRELATRVMASHPGLKCLFMSGYTANVIARQGVLDEGVWFLQKPFSIDDLALQVRKVLEQA
ncbi:MAG: response regulator [Anaerolineae bacterium]|nr:response regulator [Anaerolineae bacterium]